MNEERVSLSEIQYRRLFPWLVIFRCFKLAVDPKKLLIALVGLTLFSVGWHAINLGFMHNVFVAEGEEGGVSPVVATDYPWAANGIAPRVWAAYGTEGESPLEVLNSAVDNPLAFLWHIATRWEVLLLPFRELMEPFRAIFSARYMPSRLSVTIPAVNWTIDAGYLVYLVALALWASICWGIAGGAISRIAAMQLGRDERVTLRESLGYTFRYAVSLITAPFIPLFGVALFTFFCLVGGWISNIPAFGPFFAGVLWFLPLLAGLILALLVVGWAVGWPLMVPTLAVEGSDAFDAVSRAFAYSYQRPWNYLFYGFLAVVYGAIATFIYLLFAQLTIYLSVWAVAWGASDQLLADLIRQLPGYTYRLLAVAATASEQPSTYVQYASYFMMFWIMLVVMTGPAFVYSFFWSVATAVYLLLRRDVDATDMDEIWVEEEEEDLFSESFSVETQATPEPATVGQGATEETGAATTGEAAAEASSDTAPGQTGGEQQTGQSSEQEGTSEKPEQS